MLKRAKLQKNAEVDRDQPHLDRDQGKVREEEIFKRSRSGKNLIAINLSDRDQVTY